MPTSIAVTVTSLSSTVCSPRTSRRGDSGDDSQWRWASRSPRPSSARSSASHSNGYGPSVIDVGEATISAPDPKADLHHYLQMARYVMLWKLEGLSEHDVRRPLVRTGTNLLGLVKHLTGVEAGYFGGVFDRPFDEPMPWMDGDAEPNSDMWATADESREEIVALYERVWAHADVTIENLDLDAVGHVWWWPEDRREATLHRILVHVIAETHRHAGHADIVRELIDGAVGHRAEVDNLPDVDDAWWAGYRNRLEEVARDVGRVDG